MSSRPVAVPAPARAARTASLAPRLWSRSTPAAGPAPAAGLRPVGRRPRPLAAALVAVAALALLVGCGEEEKGAKAAKKSLTKPDAEATFAVTGVASPSPTPARSVAPAASAGGLCRQFTFDRVASLVGVRFEVAAASGKAGSEQVCVLQQVGVAAPDLTFSKLPLDEEKDAEPPAEGDEAPLSPVEAFRSDYQPQNAKNLGALGRAAYSRVVAAAGGGGPMLEVGWLGTANVFILSHTTAPGTTPAVAAKQLATVVALAKELAR